LSILTNRLRLLCWGYLVLALIAGCGPPLSEPSSTNISGRWLSSNRIGRVSDIVMDLTQRPDGTVEGTWTAKSNPATVDCPPGLGANPTGPVSGRNTVLEVNLSVVGVGDFHGQALEGNALKGNFVSCDIYPAAFTLLGPIPGG